MFSFVSFNTRVNFYQTNNIDNDSYVQYCKILQYYLRIGSQLVSKLKYLKKTFPTQRNEVTFMFDDKTIFTCNNKIIEAKRERYN